MRPEQLEAWVLSLVDQVGNGAKIEDSRVELKAEWPEPRTAARRIAGHANAAGGDAILWVIGLNEQKGVVPFMPLDIAKWRAQLAAEFDALDPPMTDLFVPTAAGPLIALLFDTSRRPYVVKNAVHGSPGGGPVSLEVPWRVGTSVRSARREELLRIMVPLQALPHVELLSSSARAMHRKASTGGEGRFPAQRSEHIEWRISLNLYITPRTPELLVLPVHKASFSFRHGDCASVNPSEVRFSAPWYHTGTGFTRDSQTIATTSGEAVISGPGKLHVEAIHYEPIRPVPPDQPLEVALSIIPADSDRKIEITELIPAGAETPDVIRSWTSDPPK
jgi:hypothetical protein